MRNLLLFSLILLFFGVSDCRPAVSGKEISEYIWYDDDDICYKRAYSWIDLSTDFMQNIGAVMFSPTPTSKANVETMFLSFSRKDGQVPLYLTNQNFTSWSMYLYDFDPTIKTIFIVHGYKGHYASWTRKLKDALLLRENCNVFIVEWGHPSDGFGEVLKDIPEVGMQVALFVGNLKNSTGLNMHDIHMIGFSVGAQIAAFAAQEIKNTEKIAVGRITGLDPAGPGFYDAPLHQRLDATDASFVDILHTNMGCNRWEGFGYPKAIGHIDFYPNGGQLQPGCLTIPQFLGKMDSKLAKIAFNYLFRSIDETDREIMTQMLCSHSKAYDLFIASIANENCKFHSVQCPSWNHYVSGECNDTNKIVVGYYADKHRDIVGDGTPKKFYFQTTDYPLHCI